MQDECHSYEESDRVTDSELHPARMLEIAEDLAERHVTEVHPNHTETSATASSFLQALERSFELGRELLEEVLSSKEADELRERLCAFPRKHADRFDARLRRGRFLPRAREAFSVNVGVGVLVSDVHPDRLDIDVAWDLAAITTELNALGRVDLSETLLSAYARCSDDYDLYAVIDFYEGLHALDCALRLLRSTAARGHSEGEAASLRDEARRKLLIALAAKRMPLVPPQVIAMSGRVACGKSTLGRHLGDVISAPIVVADLVRVAVLEAPIDEALPEAVWKLSGGGDLYEAVYGELLRRSEIVLASGRPVVIDACFPTRGMRARAQKLAEAFGAPFLFVECRAPREVVRERLLARSRRDSVAPSVWFDIADAYDEHLEEADELPPSQRLIIDTSRPLEDNARTLHPRIVAGHQVPVPGIGTALESLI